MAATERLEEGAPTIEELQPRADMLCKLSQGQINLLDHGSWDIRDI
ncbi:MAG: hypothetical protein R3191_06050 [Anaerolineales bacterium]|nr:hypothetical protein [Anaerolineales bacterium]